MYLCMQGFMATRQAAILSITSLVLWPLCNLKSLAALAPVSMVAVAGLPSVGAALVTVMPSIAIMVIQRRPNDFQ